MAHQQNHDRVPAAPAGSTSRRPSSSPEPPLWYAAAVPLLLAVLAGAMVIAGS